MSVSDTLIDTLFDGRYRIVRKLGAGGMANVYLAEDQELGRRVAIKILNDRHANDEQFVERFRREAKSAAGLSHPNIVSIYDRGEAEGTYYIAMEHLDGRTLKELIVSRGPAPVHVAIDYARQILAALRFAHRHGIVHRDIKPHNVLVDSEGRVKVTDFGIARAGASQMTEAGSIIGTAQYLSPEQARGSPVDQRSDIYSLGIVLYELLTGSVPFTGDSPVEIAMKHLSATPQPPSSRRPDVPRDVDLVVLRSLAKDPDDRYQTAEEMDADLGRVARGASVSDETADAATAILRAPPLPTGAAAARTVIRQPTPAYPPQPPAYYDYEERPRRRSVWPWLFPLLLVALAAAGGWLLYQQIQEQLAADEPIRVPLLEGKLEKLAVAELDESDIPVKVVRRPNRDEQVGFVYDQTPDAGDLIDRDTGKVTIFVSTGPAKRVVPALKGKTLADAVALLASRNLEANAVKINSNETEDTVIAQDPKAGEVVIEGSRVRINVSAGPKPVAVPDVTGQAYETAAGRLQGAGFAVARQDVESDEAEGIVVGQDPPGGTLAAAGASVTLLVSLGPTTSAVPTVESLLREDAEATLRAAGFRARVTREDTDDPTLENVVLRQDPPGGTQAEPGTRVTIVLGRYVPPVETEPPPPPPTTTAPPGTEPPLP
jgi:eukaryotic-like serine/threonine-protein kinase